MLGSGKGGRKNIRRLLETSRGRKIASKTKIAGKMKFVDETKFVGETKILSTKRVICKDENGTMTNSGKGVKRSVVLGTNKNSRGDKNS